MGWLVLIECQTQNKSFSFHCWVGPKLWPYFHLYYLARLCSPLVSQCYLAVTDAYWIHPVLPSLLDFYSSLYLFVKAAGEVDDRVAFIDLFKYKICLTIAGVIPHAFVFLRRDFKCATLRFKIDHFLNVRRAQGKIGSHHLCSYRRSADVYQTCACNQNSIWE